MEALHLGKLASQSITIKSTPFGSSLHPLHKISFVSNLVTEKIISGLWFGPMKYSVCIKYEKNELTLKSLIS